MKANLIWEAPKLEVLPMGETASDQGQWVFSRHGSFYKREFVIIS